MLDVEKLKNDVPLHEAIARYSGSELKFLGRGKWKCLCVFHSEKTPSMHVNDDEGYFHCFGCGESGDLVGFVQKHLSVDFIDAVTTLAEDFGIDVGTPGADDSTPESALRTQILAANAAAEAAYATALLDTEQPSAAAAYSLMRDKKLTHAVAKPYGLGLAPGGQWLYTRLREEFSTEVLVKADLVRQTRSGYVRDRFANRLLFSLRDHRGRVVGFNGRKLPGTEGGKYDNTAATPVYNKSATLFGIDQAKATIRATRTAIVVEGSTDVLAIASAGAANAVASCGTAFGIGHLQIIRSILGDGDLTLVFVFDGDAAGIEAAYKAWGRMKAHTTATLKGHILPGDQDPNDLWRSGQGKVLSSISDTSIPLAQLLIDRALAVTQAPDVSPEQVSAAVADACALLDGWIDKVAANQYRSYIARSVGVSTTALPDPQSATGTADHVEKRTSGLARESSDLEREALRLIAQSAEAAAIVGDVPPEVWSTQQARDTAHYLSTLHRQYPGIPIHKAIDRTTFPHRDDCFRLIMEPTRLTPPVTTSDYAAGVASMLKRHAQTHTAAAQLAEVRRATTPEDQRAALQKLLSTRQRRTEE